MKTLFTFAGPHDPYRQGDTDLLGPVLSVLRQRSFDRVVIFHTGEYADCAALTVDEVSKEYPQVTLDSSLLPVYRDTEPEEILGHLLDDEAFADLSEIIINLDSGVPMLDAIWFLMLAGGKIDASLVRVSDSSEIEQVKLPTTYSVPGSSRGKAKEPNTDYEVDTTPTMEFIDVSDAGDQQQEPGFSLEEARQSLGLKGTHPAFLDALESAESLAEHDVPVLIRGETGTGKTAVARLIHLLSGRTGDRFITVNCGALPETLVESILFGHKKGAFTGAGRDQEGKFVTADGGTLFLDEIGELPLAVQPKLLNVLDDGLVEPLGASKGKKVNVRLIAATHRDLKRQVTEGTFREDLFYRINYGQVTLPPLRDRHSDIPALAEAVLKKLNRSLKSPKSFSEGALKKLESLPWKGNVRDLEHVIGRSALMSSNDLVDKSDLIVDELELQEIPVPNVPDLHSSFSLEEYLGSMRKQIILKALELSEGKQSRAARILGITPQAVNKFIRTLEA